MDISFFVQETGHGKKNANYIIMDKKNIYCFSVHFGVV